MSSQYHFITQDHFLHKIKKNLNQLSSTVPQTVHPLAQSFSIPVLIRGVQQHPTALPPKASSQASLLLASHSIRVFTIAHNRPLHWALSQMLYSSLTGELAPRSGVLGYSEATLPAILLPWVSLYWAIGLYCTWLHDHHMTPIRTTILRSVRELHTPECLCSQGKTLSTNPGWQHPLLELIFTSHLSIHTRRFSIQTPYSQAASSTSNCTELNHFNQTTTTLALILRKDR